MTFAQRYYLRPGDELISPIFKTGLTKHHVLYLGIDENGVELMSENDAKEGVRLVTAQDYFARTEKFQVKPFEGTERERQTIVTRAYSQLGKRYDLVHHNCEHHTSYVRMGIAASKQVAVALGLVTIFLISWLATAAGKSKRY